MLFALALLAAPACGPSGPAPSARQREDQARTRVAMDLGGALAAAGVESGNPIFIRIFKDEGELEVWLQGADGYRLVRTYEICRWSGNLGPKLREGDRQAPEGFYFVNRGRMNPNSNYHLAFNIGYPNAYDRHYGRTGSAIMVHGGCDSIGCYAMTDPGIEEIYGLADAALANGQPIFRVHVFPYRMTDENMNRHRNSGWHEFWTNLKEGHDIFERLRIPPDVRVEEGRYVFDDPESAGSHPAASNGESPWGAAKKGGMT